MTALAIRNAATLCAAFYFCAAGAAPTAQAPVTGPKPATAAANVAAATLFGAVSDKPAIVYDAPSQKAAKIFILARFQPVEVLVKLDKWIKIRDAENTLGWVENGALGGKRFVQVAATVADVRATSSATAALVFEAQRAVLLEVTGPAVEGWLPVKHRDGQSGYVRKSQVWGD